MMDSNTTAQDGVLTREKLLKDIREFMNIEPIPAPPRIMALPGTVQSHRRRSWVERLFSRPWRPLQKFKTVDVENPALPPKGEGYHYVKENVIFVRPDDFEKFKALAK